MEEKPPLQSLLTHCKLTICDKISSDDGKLNSFLTNTLKFKIIEVDPLVIEKDCPSPDDIYKLLDALNNLQHSNNSKDYKSVEHTRGSIELEQKKGNIQCDNAAQKSSSQSVDENRKLTDCSIVNYCDGNSAYEVASQQTQGSNDDVSDLTNSFQSLKMIDVSNDHGQKHKEFANNLSGNTLRELTNAPQKPENESITLRENVTVAEKQKDYCQDIGEEENQIETTQQEYLTKQGNVADHRGANVQTMQNTTTATENEMKHNRNYKQKQDGQYEFSTDTNTHEMDATHTKLTTDKKNNSCQVSKFSKEVNKQSNKEDKSEDQESGLIENAYRKTTDCIKHDEDGESTNKIIAAQNVITSKQSPCRQDKGTDYSSSEVQTITESERQGKMDQQVHSQDVKTDKKNSTILKDESADSSDSDAESQHNIIYSVKASSLDGIRMYFKGVCSDKYFDDVKIDGTSYTFKLSLSEEDVSFLKKLKQIKVEEFKFDQKDKVYFNLAVKDIQSQVRETIAYITDNYVHIVGLKDSVISAKKKLQDIVTNYKSTARTESLDKNSPFTQRNLEKSRISDYDKTYKSGRSQKFEDNEMPQSHDVYSPSSSPPEDHYIKQKADKTTYSGNNKHVIFSHARGIFYARNERMLFQVQISKTDITKLEVDCIVNAANKRLQHGGGVAKAISLAAGPALNKECEDFTRFGSRQVAVTDIFVSTGGKMPAKWVMHAVGPKWEAYEAQKKEQCFEDLRHTVVRCLVEADRREFTSIALPSISAAIFKVPKEECARCYMEAVKHFGLFTEQTSVQDIRFVDVDDAMVTIIQEHFEKNWTKSCDSYIVQKDCDFAKRHVYTGNRNAATNMEKSHDKSKFTSTSSVSIKSSGAGKASSDQRSILGIGSTASSPSEMRTNRRSAYLIGKFTVCTDTKPAFNLPADITIIVGKPFDKLSGLPDFSVSSNKKKKEGMKNIYKMYEVSKPKSSQRRKLCTLLPEPDDAEAIKKAFGNLETIIQSPNHKMFTETVKNVVLTSSILYSEPYNTHKKDKKNTCDRKKVGHFAKCLFDYLLISGVAASTITLVGSEDALQIICKVIESRDVKKISLEAHTSSYQEAGSRRGDNSDHQQSSYRSHFDDKRSDNEASSSSHHRAVGRGSTRGENSDHQQSNSLPYARSFSDDKQYGSKNAGSSVDLEKICEICVNQKTNHSLRCCSKYVCQDCEKKTANCPYCRTFWRVLIGDQPRGTMRVYDLQVYPFWEINYTFPSGFQEACHPNPGAPYTGITRIAYLPRNEDGLDVLMLLRIAFLRRLTFTIGRSLTTNRENSIIWNDIHHKTSLNGGPHSYPDPNYLIRVRQELKNKGVTFESISADEEHDINALQHQILTSGFFF
ncbi:hypothetical protein BsWGS_01970 [Bradybaena similaris]